MLTRITHAAIAFALTAVAYQAYVLAVVPFVEPDANVARQTRQSKPDQWREGRAAPERYRELLAAYFPRDHWCLSHAPKTFENGQALVVLDDYQQSNSGELRVPRCAIVFFSRVRDRGAAPPRDAIILEPLGGAILQMDQRLSEGVGGIGRMQYGQLLGEVIVRSDMRDPGPQDDLSITTRDLYMNEDLIRTAESVEIRLGPHFGRGRGLEIRFLPLEPSSGAAPASIYGRLDSLEISHDVSGVVAPGKTSLFGPKETTTTRQSDANSNGKVVQSPIRVQSAGPFRIDFGHYVASFMDQVQVRQLHPDGKLDELDATELNLYFTKVQQWEGEASDDESATKQTADENGASFESFVLEPETIEAKGGAENPVRLAAPSHDATARGERLVIELTPQQVTLEGGEEVTLTYQGGKIHAPMVQYQLPPRGSTARVGTLRANGGAGRLQAVVDPKRPDQILEVTWKDAMQLVRRNGQPVLILDGRPRVSMLPMGTLYADSLELFLRDQPADGAQSPIAPSGGLPSTVTPERLTAAGHVVIQSAQINGRVNQLELKIDYPPPVPGGPPSGGDSSTSAAAFLPGQGQQGQRSYDIDGIVLSIKAAMRNRRPEVTGISVDGAVVFKEAPLGGGEAPLQIAADKLRVTQADSPNAQIDILGVKNGSPAQWAEIASRGAVIRAPQLTVNRGTSEAWVNSPGEVKMLVDRDATGTPLAQPQPLSIVWQDSMRLLGDRITFSGKVEVKHADGWLHTRRLVAQLTAPIRFDGASGQQAPELAQIECWEGAEAEFGQRDLTGAVTSHQQIKIQSLKVNQITGAISGEGPGHVDSVHLSRGAEQIFQPPAALGRERVEATGNGATGEPTLRHLSIDFVSNVEGNLHLPRISVFGDVRTVYGPVGNWGERLAMDPGGRPGPDTVWITCDELQVAGSQLARVQNPATGGRPNPFSHVELLARKRVVIEGENPTRGAFTLRGYQATYDQVKDMFVLQGDGREPAIITHQQYPGAPPSDQSAQKFIYYPSTGTGSIEGSNKIQLNGFGNPDRKPETERR